MRSVLLAALLLQASALVQAQAPAGADCVLVFSKGQNLSPGDAQVNRMWNQLNDAFGQFVAERLQAAGRRVVDMPHPVEATDTAANTDRLLKKAQQEGCSVIVSTSMYADGRTRQFVSALRVNPVAVLRTELPAGTRYTVGEESFRREQTDPLSRETLDRLVPSEIARTLIDAYLGTTP